MVDFRYHVVSIVAVFLALAVGIVLGTTVVDEAVVSSLRGQARELARDKEALRGQVERLQDTVETDTAFHKAIGPLLVKGALSGRRVVVVAAPQVDRSVRTGMVATLQTAGADVTGTVRLLPRLYDPASADEVDDLVSRLVPAGVNLRRPTTAERAAALLAAVLATTGDGAAAANPTAEGVLAGLKDAGVLDVEGLPAGREAPGPAPIQVVLLPTPDPNADPVAKESLARSNVALLAVVDALGRAGRVTVAVSPSGGADEGGALRMLRADAARSSDVSTVDLVDTEVGRLSAVLAIVEALRGGHGHYGTGTGAESLTPPSPPPS